MVLEERIARLSCLVFNPAEIEMQVAVSTLSPVSIQIFIPA